MLTKGTQFKMCHMNEISTEGLATNVYDELLTKLEDFNDLRNTHKSKKWSFVDLFYLINNSI